MFTAQGSRMPKEANFAAKVQKKLHIHKRLNKITNKIVFGEQNKMIALPKLQIIRVYYPKLLYERRMRRMKQRISK